MRYLSLGLLSVFSVYTFGDGVSCREFNSRAEEFRQHLPILYGDGLEFRRHDTNCKSKIITDHLYYKTKYREEIYADNLRFEQDQWVQSQCDIKGMSFHGWTYVKKYYDRHGVFVYSIVSMPEMCSRE